MSLNQSKEIVGKLGKLAVEGMINDPKYHKKLEKMGIAKEDLYLGSDKADVYTTAIASFIEERMRPQLTAMGVIKTINNFDAKGHNAIKVPLRTALITASNIRL